MHDQHPLLPVHHLGEDERAGELQGLLRGGVGWRGVRPKALDDALRVGLDGEQPA